MPYKTFVSSSLRENEIIISQNFENRGDDIVVTEVYEVTLTPAQAAVIKDDLLAKKTELESKSFAADISALGEDINSINAVL